MTPSELEALEAEALEHLAEEEGLVEADLEASSAVVDEGEPERSPVRLAVAMAFPTLAAAVMAGGVFIGLDARFYAAVAGLSHEVRQKLAQIRPSTVGQAARVAGVTPAAVSILLVHLKKASRAA